MVLQLGCKVPQAAESSFTSKSYRREMTGMFKVNKTGWGKIVDKV